MTLPKRGGVVRSCGEEIPAFNFEIRRWREQPAGALLHKSLSKSTSEGIEKRSMSTNYL
jgi:hypothetical protein